MRSQPRGVRLTGLLRCGRGAKDSITCQLYVSGLKHISLFSALGVVEKKTCSPAFYDQTYEVDGNTSNEDTSR